MSTSTMAAIDGGGMGETFRIMPSTLRKVGRADCEICAIHSPVQSTRRVVSRSSETSLLLTLAFLASSSPRIIDSRQVVYAPLVFTSSLMGRLSSVNT